jgi:glycerol-3-phosphate acyltransferase PlsX
MTTICVDAMGGDEEPSVVCQGIAEALATDVDLMVLVAGTDEVVTPFCERNDRAQALVCTEVIGMGEHPTQAVRSKRDSSIVRGCKAVREGAAEAFFSAGSTGAILAAGTLGIGRIKGIGRPALATALPGLDGHETVVTDIGANADCTSEQIVQFARMGAAYAALALGCDAPKVGLLSNGSEDTKGNAATLGYHEALAAELPSFVGNAEGSDLLLGSFDVIVGDGFTVNCAIKAIEGCAKFMSHELKAAAHASVKVGLGGMLVKPAIKGVAASLSGDVYGGANLLGLKAPVLVGHGATSVEAIKNGTLAAATAVRGDLVGKLAAACA